MGDPEAHVMARPLRAPLRRSFSDHIRDSTARALDVIWKNTRDRRLAAVKSVKLEVDEDKSTKGSNFSNSEVAIGLSPYTSSRKRLFHVPETENIAWAGVCLAELVHSSLLWQPQKKEGGLEGGGVFQ
uniref:rho GTPase-activating protein 7 isoform X6 n=1 Tax=Callithrix jacchus TaxID=9483 RepID=UPI0023DD2EBF|nr:rho GTPase-activating protein 7 isoform X6 [Callithrix jacchus]